MADLRKQADMAETTADPVARKHAWDQANPDKVREYQRRYYLKNREKILARQKANPEQTREYKRQWQAANPEKAREARRRWREANPDKVRAQQHRGRNYQRRYYETNRSKWREQQRKRNHGMDLATFMAMWEAQGGCCYLCRRDLGVDEAAVDHWHGCTAHDPKNSCRWCWRGLAHLACNTVIGHGGDDPDLLRIIAGNLEQANADIAARQATMPQQQLLLL